MRKYKKLIYPILMILCLSLLAGCGSSDEKTTQEGQAESYWENQSYDTLSGSDFIEVGKGGKMQLLLNPESGTIRWMNTETGAFHDSNMSYDENLANKTNGERSDLLVTYYNGTLKNNLLYSKTNRYDSYSMSSSRGQIAYQLIDNGVRVVYTLGDDSVTYQYFPKRISEERFEDLVLQYLDDRQRNTMTTTHYTQLASGDYYRNFNTNDQNKIGPLAIKEVYNMFYEVGHYTIDDLMEDVDNLVAAGLCDDTDYPSNLKIVVAVDYYLDGEELVVRVDPTKIETDASHPIYRLELLPYFLTSATDNDAEEGYMFIPDDSGALIYLDSTKTREYHYSAPFYGGDRLNGATVYNSVDNEMKMPVFGMKTSDSTVFCIIENGAEVASLDAYVSYTDMSEPFSKMKLTFDIQSQMQIEAGSGLGGTYMLYRASDDVYDEDISLRYFWLEDEAGYVEMAKCYANYLTEKGALTAETAETQAPFYVEVLGTTDKTQFMLGIPYDGKQVVTSFKEAQTILNELTDAGVKNIKMIYSGMANGGMNQRSLSSGVKFASGLGGSSAWNSLKKYADSIGAQIFPNLQLQTAYTRSDLANSVVAWNISNERAQIYSFNPVEKKIDEENDYPLFIISPNYLDKYLSKVKSTVSSKLGVSTIASSDLYSFIPTNYKDQQVSISTGEDILNNAVASLTDGMTLMLSNPISDAYGYSNYLTDIPSTNSGMRVLDASVPFMQLVLDGYKTYSTESLNRESTDVYENFMRAIESNSVPKFTFTYRDSSLLSDTEQENYFAVDYNYWKDKIGDYYKEYEQVYNRLQNATVVSHELYNRDDDLRIVTYSNGVKIYFNYSDLEENIGGVTVPAFSYVME